MIDRECALCGKESHWDKYTLPPVHRDGLVLRFCCREHLDDWRKGEMEEMGKEPKGRGRPPCDLTEAMIETAERLFCDGHATTTVAQALGVSRSTAYRWIKEGEEAVRDFDESPEGLMKSLFWDGYIKGRVCVKKEIIGNIISASKKDWRAGRWYLSVTEPADYNEQVISQRAILELEQEMKEQGDPPVTPDEINPICDPPPIVKTQA